MIYSFDVFDTIIGRDVLIPEGVFYVMQEQMMHSEYFREKIGIDKLQQFAEIRKKAERINANSKICAVTQMDQIYRILSWMIGDLPLDVLDRIKRLEIDTECKLTFGIRENIEKIKGLLEEKERVVLISDMYLSAKSIREIVASTDERLKELPIYVSSEYGCTKSDAGLFLKVKEEENANFSEWIHIGDNEIGDVIVPGLLGIDARQYQFERQLGIGNELKKDHCAHTLASNLSLGIASKIKHQKKWNKYESIGGFIGGGVLFPYVLWVVEKAIEYGISRLLFVARDGYVLKKIADVIIQERKYCIKSEYIYGSRKAWRIEEKDEKNKAIKYILDNVGRERGKVAFVDYQSAGESLDILLEDVDEIESIPYFVYGFDYNRLLKKVRPIIFDEISRGISMEVFCRAPHGVTIGYKMDDDTVAPVLAECEYDWNKSHQNDFLEGIVEYTSEMINKLNELAIVEDLRDYSEYVLKYVNSMEDQELNDYIGEIVHDSGEKYMENQYAPLLSDDEYKIIACLGEEIFNRKYYKGANLALSIKRSSITKGCNLRTVDEPRFISNRNKSKKRNNILLYTAGRQGKKYYSILNNIYEVNIVGWTDIRAYKYRKEGLPIIDIGDAFSLEIDYIMIPMSRNGNYYKSIERFLRNVGFEEEILSEEDICEYIYKILEQ